ncbi:hypothetical protein HPP92_018294 [Vanilla planifolia]|uniref:Uncharacterized protein n=1 Tax=Vanilla planifolia TaxID=51239 RepID=A0A835Q9J5_VANPL|nr:hypothetical protein HPP92_018294 [Vanilla planifolia]
MAAAAAAPPPPRLSNSLPIPLLLSLIVVASPSLVWAREHPAKYHIVDTESLPPRSSCSIPTGRSQSRVTVVHRHGPCSPLASRDDTPLTWSCFTKTKLAWTPSTTGPPAPRSSPWPPRSRQAPAPTWARETTLSPLDWEPHRKTTQLSSTLEAT